MFQIAPSFVDQYRSLPEPFGFDGLGRFVYLRTYSRGGERWVDTCARVVTGMYQLQERHCAEHGRPWLPEKAQRSAREAFDLLFHLKWTPPGRGLWMMGSDFVHKRGVVEGLCNCAFASTEQLTPDVLRWFTEMSMLGVGVGFDTRGAGTLTIETPHKGPWDNPTQRYIDDTRESWAASVARLFDAYTGGLDVEFIYDDIRPAGRPLKGFGGISSGPQPLKDLHRDMRKVLEANVGMPITSRTIVDIFNLIGRCVVSGNVRRTAEIALGAVGDTDFASLKDYRQHPYRQDWGWVSNNSVFAQRGMAYGDLAEQTLLNGEPGYVWLENARQFGRMNGLPDRLDHGVAGTNPCAEQPLWDREMCTLTEIHLPRIGSLQEFTRTLKFAYLYGKSVTLTADHIQDRISRAVMQRNRRIGLSLTGVQQFVAKQGWPVLIQWMEYGYQMTKYWDLFYSTEWLNVPESIRRTTIKPSGSVSLLSGSTPGIHWPIAPFYWRRVNVAANSPLVEEYERAGYPVEPSLYTPNTAVIAFPVSVGTQGIHCEGDLSVKEQLSAAALAQRHWSDNAVSVTVKVPKGDRAAVLEHALMQAEEHLKAVSFLPHEDHGYAQAPMEPMTAAEYERAKERLSRYVPSIREHVDDAFCDTDVCEVRK